MTHRLPVVAFGLLLAGCTVVRIEHEPLAEPGDEPSGQIRFLAVRNDRHDRLTDGYFLTVMKNWAIVGTYPSSKTRPISAEGLKPGSYDISIGGRGIETRSTRVKVRPGEATVVRLLVRNARRAERVEEFAEAAGKIVLYAVGSVLYAAAMVVLEIEDDEDEDDDDLDCPSKKVQNKPAPAGPVSKYRKK